MPVAFALLVGCPAPTPVETEPPTAPLLPDTGAPPDTGLPPAPPPAPPAVRAEVGPSVQCVDIGRDTRFFDPVLFGDTPDEAPRNWTDAGIIVDDFDGDGRFDILAPGGRSALWVIRQPGWVDIGATGLADIDLEDAVGGASADYDDDGDPDVLITRYGRHDVLLRNDGVHFTDVTHEAGIPEIPGRSASASWADVNGDGWLDLFIGGYGPPPESAYATDMPPGDPSLLLLNDGDGTFTDASALLPDSVHDGYTFGSGFYDIDVDGFPELFVLQDFGWVRPSTLLWNRGGTFEPDDGTAGFHPNFAGMGLAVGDLNGDRIPDFAQTSYQATSLLLSLATPIATGGVLWAEWADPLGVVLDIELRHQTFGWGTEFGDLDNDADLDLVMGFGKWDEYANYEWQFDGVWVQEDGTFVERAGGAKYRLDDRESTRGLLLVDLDRDGWLDVVKRFLDAPMIVHRSRCNPARHWLQVSLDDPTVANHRAVGARVTVTAGPLVQTRWIGAGSTSMFSGGPPVAHFGLLEELVVDRIEVVWPDGTVTTVDHELPVDRTIALVREAP